MLIYHVRFRKLRDLTVCEQLTETNWRDACIFWKRFSSQKNASDRIAVPGMKRQLLLVQGFAVYWMLATENSDTGGGFLADEMGLGKVGLSTWNIYYVRQDNILLADNDFIVFNRHVKMDWYCSQRSYSSARKE